MKSFFSLAVLVALSVHGNAQTLIHYWSFNNFLDSVHTGYITGIDADYSDLDTAKAKIIYAEMPGVSAAYGTYEDAYATVPADSDIYNLQLGDSAGNALRLRNPSDSMYLLFYIPTTHFKNIALAYDAESSSATHGMLQQFFSYSTDSGATWITSGGLSMQQDTVLESFHLTSVTFTDTNANNNPRLVFRIAFGPNNSGTSGNDRIDNVTVKGDSIGGAAPSLVGQVATVAPLYTIYPNPVMNTLDVAGNIAIISSVTVYNAAGQLVYTSTKQGTNFSIDVTGLNAGNYIVSIRDSNTGKSSSIKFVKK